LLWAFFSLVSRCLLVISPRGVRFVWIRWWR